jgi:hypothetical protein
MVAIAEPESVGKPHLRWYAVWRGLWPYESRESGVIGKRDMQRPSK